MAPPRLTFLVGNLPRALTPGDDQWRFALPSDRQARPVSLPSAEAVTYGDYFEAAANFLLTDDGAVLARAASRILDRPIVRPDIERVDIHLIKHGAFYHPALVAWRINGTALRMVLNVAVSSVGRATLAGEYRALGQLADGCGRGLVPQVFSCGQGRGATSKTPLEMFAGQWMEGFHEVHLTDRSPAGLPRWVVWHDDRGPLRLTDRQIYAFYRQAVFIVTRCYNPFTFESVLEWHPAAGDFVVNPDVDPLQVRLITARRYAPLFERPETRPLTLETVLEALVVFFIRTSLWIRIDRLDGVGELAWAHSSDLLEAILEGFLAGLEDMARLHGLPENFGTAVSGYLAAHPVEALRQTAETIVERLSAHLPERRLIQSHLETHIAALCALIGR